MTERDNALATMQMARDYTNNLLADVAEEDWFRMPAEGVTHLAWQLGHLAIAQYRLMMFQLRGEVPSDAELIDISYAPLFGRGSVPNPDAAQYPPLSEIRATFDRVHAQALEEVARYNDQALAAPPQAPHRLFTTKLGAVMWAPQHEFIHCGQIGLLKRLLGHTAKW
jgi:hypothetical protein